MIIRIIIMITIFIIIIMRMLRASCAQLEEAKQGSFTYNQGYHRLKWGEAPCFNSKWGQFLSVTQPTLFVGHCYCWSICGCMMFSRSAHSSKLQKTNAGTWVRLKTGFFFVYIAVSQTYHSDGGNDDPLDHKEFAMENHHVSVR